MTISLPRLRAESADRGGTCGDRGCVPLRIAGGAIADDQGIRSPLWGKAAILVTDDVEDRWE